MGTVKGNWLTGAHSGRACNHEDIYTKVDKKTGKCYSVKLCNPNDKTSADQAAQRNTFGMLSAAISSWIKEQKALKSDAYNSVKAAYDRQTKYSTLRGYMMAKNMAEVIDDETVKITVAGEVFNVKVAGINVTHPDDTNGGSTGGGSTTRQYTISVTSANTTQGTVTGGGTYSEGSRVNISATPKSGFQFDKWSDGNTSATRTINVSKNESFVAQFIASTGSGTGTEQSGGTTEPGDENDDENYV